MSLFSEAELALRSDREAHAAIDAIYKRGSIQVDIRATQGESRTRHFSKDGLTAIMAKNVDFIIDAVHLAIFGEVQPGDKIVIGAATYEVASITGTRVWDWHGRDNLSVRVHTIEVAS